jgi:membrane-associated phospholipid phosphatase
MSPETTIDGLSLRPLVALRPAVAMSLSSVAIVLFVVAGCFMQGGNIEGFTAVQAVTRAWPDGLWSWITVCGTGVVAFALLAPTLTRQPRWFAAAIVVAPLAGLFSNGFKRFFALPRPAAVIDPEHLHVIGQTLRHNAFPSGHSVTAFALASLLVFASRTPLKTALWTLPCAALIAASRIAVGAHWPADLAAGAAGGWVCGAIGVVVVARWRAWNTRTGIRLMGLVAIGIGLSLFVVDLGYPQAVLLQYAMGIVAIASGAVAIVGPKPDPLLPYVARPTT